MYNLDKRNYRDQDTNDIWNTAEKMGCEFRS